MVSADPRPASGTAARVEFSTGSREPVALLLAGLGIGTPDEHGGAVPTAAVAPHRRPLRVNCGIASADTAANYAL